MKLTLEKVIEFHQDKVDNWYMAPAVKQKHKDIVTFLTELVTNKNKTGEVK